MDTVESVCNHLARYKVLDAETVRNLRAKWREQTGERSEMTAEFKRWLVRTGRVTDFQLELLARGHGEHLYLEEYKLLDRIGKGRNSGVYQAVHSAWGQMVAIKVLPPSKGKNPMILGRFLREGRLAFRLDHDNIVRTFHFGHTRENMHYIVMEYLDGETVDEMIKRRKNLPVAEATELMIQAMQGVAHMDEKGMIHRDLKPANMVLVPAEGSENGKKGDGEKGKKGAGEPAVVLKILDIGLSRALFDEGDPNSGEQVDLTREGALLGTMNYMAPEQARDAHAADIRADIYSMGCVFYELLTGQPPFADNNLARQIRRHAQEKPRPLPEVVPGIPEALDRIVQKMLAKDPAMRYLTPGQVVKDLRAFLSREPTATASASAGEPPATAHPVRPLGPFLTWLETKRAAEPNGDLPTPGTVPVQARPTEPVKRGETVPAARAAAAPARAVSSPTGTLLEPMPPPPVAPAAAVATAKMAAANGAAPTARQQALPAAPSAPKESSLTGTAGELGLNILRLFKEIFLSLGRLKGRDWICIASGVMVTLAVLGLWKLIRG